MAHYAFADDCFVNNNQENDPNARKLFGKAIRQRRRELDLTQEELAEAGELHRTYISNLESGKINPSLDTITKLAKALDISVWALFLRAGF